MLRRIEVMLFVDWNAQIYNAGQARERCPSRQVENTLEFVTKTIARILSRRESRVLFTVLVRVYHGWYRGLTITENRKELDLIIKENNAPASISNVRFDWKQPFGDVLLDALDFRKHDRCKIHLPDTLRCEDDTNKPREKMVDTAMVCDVLYSARTDPESWRVIMAEDDDFVPAVFVAEKWSSEKGGRTVILRKRAECGHLKLSGLVWQMEG